MPVVFLSFFFACIAFYELTHFHGHVELPANHVTSSRKTCTCVCVRKSVNGTLEKLAQLSLGLVEMARCIRWQHLRRFECVSFAWLRSCSASASAPACVACHVAAIWQPERKVGRGAGSRRGWLQQCNTKYYKQAELAKSSAKLLPNSSMRSKQEIFLFLLHVCGNPATRPPLYPSMHCLWNRIYCILLCVAAKQPQNVFALPGCSCSCDICTKSFPEKPLPSPFFWLPLPPLYLIWVAVSMCLAFIKVQRVPKIVEH